MKFIITFCIVLIFQTASAQTWFDRSCKNINDKVNEEEFKLSNERNVLKIIINQASEIEINGQVNTGLSEIGFKELVLDFVTNPRGNKSKAAKPDKVFIQLKSFNNDKAQLANLNSYVQDVYLYLWDKKADEEYGSTYLDLKCNKRERVFNAYPLRIVSDIAESKSKSSLNNTLRKGPSLPPFGGDATKN